MPERTQPIVKSNRYTREWMAAEGLSREIGYYYDLLLNFLMPEDVKV